MFGGISEILHLKGDERFSKITASTSCLAAIVEAESNEEVSKLVDFLTDLKVKEKHLQVEMHIALNTSLLAMKTINYNVIINHIVSGVHEKPFLNIIRLIL